MKAVMTDLILSVISGDSLVGQRPQWRGDRRRGQSFSNLWRFSGGATSDNARRAVYYDLSVISGDSLVGQRHMP